MKQKLYDLTSAQNSIWLTEQFCTNTCLNNVGGYVFIKEKVNFQLLEKALNLYVQKNDALNLRLTLIKGEVKQYIHPYTPFNIELNSLKNMQEVNDFNKNFTSTSFNIFDSNLYKFSMFSLPDGTGGFNATLHHLISDAWNMSLLISQIMDAYSCLVKGEIVDSLPFPSYIDYLSSEKEYFESTRFQKDSTFWNEIFDSEPQLSYITSNNESVSNMIANRKIFDLDSNFYKKISNFCREFNLSIYTFFMSIYLLYIAKLNNTHDPIIGTPVLNRSNFKEKNTAGMFISTVPFKIHTNPNDKFTAFVKSVAVNQLGIFRHQKYPYDKLLNDVKNKYGISDNLYDIVLSYQNARDDKNSSDIDYVSEWLFNNHTLDTLQIHFYDMDDTGNLKLFYDYQIDKLSEEDIDNIHNRIIHMANTVLNNPDILVKDIEIVTEKEKQLLLDFHSNSFIYDKNKSIVSIFEDEVKKHPNKKAVVFEDKCLTYEELNTKANQLAHILIKNGMKKNQIVSIMLPRSLETLICVWAILKSGSGYMLIDTSLPEERIQYMLNNAKSPLLITNSDIRIDFDNILYLDKMCVKHNTESNYSPISCDNYINPNVETSNDDTFCLIYTSGSTGTPKGVELKRIGVINMVYSYQQMLNTNTCENFLSTSTVAFDMFIVENFVSLLSGKTVILANDEEQKVPIFMSNLIKKYNIDFILSTPSKIELLLLNEEISSCLKSVKVIQLGGEVFKEKLYNRLANCTNAKIFNGYGPSECTACCSNKEIIDGQDITIGKPLLNTKIYLLNSDLNLVPIGYNGEICVSGDGVGKGYVQNDELTSKVFIANPFENGKNIYKTGDIGKYKSNGELMYLGRRDAQVKLRGLRIELDEITNKILRIDGIANAVSIIKKVNNIDCICSYVVKVDNISKQNTQKSSDFCDTIKSKLKEELPHYMIPSHIIFLDSLPITLNGKVDIKKLPDIALSQIEYIEPKTKNEKELCNLWTQILHIEKISTNANFFDLGGDSLCCIKLVSEVYRLLGIKISIKDVFDYPTIQTLSQYISTIDKTSASNVTIKKVVPQDSYTLSSAQKRIYYTAKLNPSSVSYNTSGGLILNKLPDVKKLEQCFNKLIKRHSSLRTYFALNNDEVRQKVANEVPFSLEMLYVDNKNPHEVFKEFVKPFNLEKAPLFRAGLYTFADGQVLLLIDMHHIICDGESIAIFVDELCKLYNGDSLPEFSLNYIDYATWEQNNINSNQYKKSENYWLKKLDGELPILNMPTHTRPSLQSFEGNKIYEKIENANEIFDFCKKLNTTPFMFLLSIYYILLYKYTNQNDIIVGSPIVGRDIAEINNIVGMFVNTLALRMSINSGDTFNTFLNFVSANCLSAFENQTYPFDELVKKIDINRDTSRNPLFDTMFIYQNNGKPKVHLDDIQTTYYVPNNNTSKFDFSLEITPENNVLNLSLEYCTSLFSKKFMQDFLSHYTNILHIVMKNPSILLRDITILSKSELSTVIEKFNKTDLDYPKDKTIIELFEEQVNQNKDNIALIYKNEKITYEELNKKVNYLANHLNCIGVNKGDIVCTLLPRSSDLIISMLAIMKCGAVYLPISTTFPIDRMQYIIQNSKSKFIITNTKQDINCSEFETTSIYLDKIPNNIPDNNRLNIELLPDDVIYTIYTSGSTGAPKGVQIMNKNLNNFIHSFKKSFDYSVNYKDICLATTSISFDVSIWEFFFTLLNGATLYLYEKEGIEDIFDYCNCMIKNKITMAYIPPNILTEVYSILSENTQVKLEKILLGVEPIKSSVVAKYFNLNPNMKIVNGYGPTETTICTTSFKVKNTKSYKYNIVPIGKPFHNMKAYIVDCDFNILPVGVPGELYVSGDNVGKGYLNNPELTNQRYIKSPFDDGTMYKTGDVVKWLPDGNIMFVGRNDGQVKIKGHRIELNEITSAMLSYPTITKSVVLVKEDKENKFLVAYFTASKKVIVNDLRSFLSLKLPFYNIPNFFIQLDKFALTANGKIDLNYLKNMDLETNTYYEPPRNEFEKQLIQLWKDFLKIDKIGINDNFFDLGGDSLIAIKLQIEAFKLGINISYADIFSYPTIKQLSSKVSIDTNKMHICNFDYTNIDNILSKNKLPISSEIKKINIKDILLTGVTGFVGIHILDKLLSNTTANIYCLVRTKNNVDYVSRLIKTLQFYFGDKYNTLIGTRIRIIEGDITRKNFGLSSKDYEEVSKNISCVINSAAIVKHYGKSTLFDETNITGVQNIVDFCQSFGIKLYHISTLSVSGNVFSEDSYVGAAVEQKVTFTEENLYVNQDLSNIYIYTKFMAERLILNYIYKSNVNATIIRLGNITSRYSDGQFQINASENAFLNRLNSFIKLKCIPDYLIDGYTEFTPVDCCADAISKIIQYDFPYTVLHLFNNNHIGIKHIIDILKEYGLDIDIVDNETFLNVVDIALQTDKNILSGIINDFNINKKLVYESNITLDNSFTNEFLKHISFDWPKIDKNYIFKYLNYLKNIGYIE